MTMPDDDDDDYDDCPFLGSHDNQMVGLCLMVYRGSRSMYGQIYAMG